MLSAVTFTCNLKMISNTAFTLLLIFACVFLSKGNHCPIVHHNPQDLPFRNVSLDWDERVDDLVGRLSIDQVIDQLSHGGRSPESGPAPAIPCLGIKEYSWNTECLRGLANAGSATSFPQALGLAASFNRSLSFAIAEATSKEARAKLSSYIKNNSTIGNHMGISCFSPVINIMRHPLWGRNQETYGEDPYLSGELGKMHIQGLQGDHPRYIRANGGCKHFSVHSGPEDIPVSRFSFDAQVSERDWQLTFLPAFYSCIVEGGSYSTMCSYNSINGVPACANQRLLTQILRNEWKFKGYVISDQDALVNIVDAHHWKNSTEEAAIAALLAGTNIELCTDGSRNIYSTLHSSVQKSLIHHDVLKEAVKPLFYVRMRLGEFDPPEMNPYTKYDTDLIQSEEHRELAILAATQSFVLLKNHGILPLNSTRLSRLAILGPMTDNPAALNGDYAATMDLRYVKTPGVGLSELANITGYNNICSDMKCTDYAKQNIASALEIPNDLIIVCLGTGMDIESESRDRSDLHLPGKQSQLLQDVIDLSGNTPIVLLLFSAGPLQIEPTQLAAMDAIVNCFLPSQATGDALLRLFLNQKPGGNPAGRLPFTWPTDISQIPDMTSYEMNNRTYRYWDQDTPLYPFGYGQSYTTFSYSNLIIDNDRPSVGDDVLFQVDIINTGDYDGDEVVQAYIEWVAPQEPMPKLQLVAFERVHIPSGNKIQWEGKITATQMAVYMEYLGFIKVIGDINLYVGGQQPNQVVHLSSPVLQGKITIVDAPKVVVVHRGG